MAAVKEQGGETFPRGRRGQITSLLQQVQSSLPLLKATQPVPLQSAEDPALDAFPGNRNLLRVRVCTRAPGGR